MDDRTDRTDIANLVGALAALVSHTKKVGFVGGMDIPLIHKFEAGYRAGVKKVCPDCQIIAQYAGVTPDAFKNPGKGKELALSTPGRATAAAPAPGAGPANRPPPGRSRSGPRVASRAASR